MNVRKRSGKVVPFDAEFISRAISLASAAAGEHDEEEIAHITQAVTDKLKARGGEIWDIETIQDTVEETLVRDEGITRRPRPTSATAWRRRRSGPAQARRRGS